MENIIDKIYCLHLKTDSFPFGMPNKETMDEEWQLYNFLYENLPDEYKELFLKYVDIGEIRQSEERKAVYEYGFKTAIKLIVESLKE